MTGRVMIVTGASSGIGFEVARQLAEGGNDVIIACRNPDKGKAAVERIRAEFANSLVTFMELDLASQSSVRDFVKHFMSKKRKLNLLVNNAAMSLNYKDLTRKTTVDGNEVTMATNHLGPFLLTHLLMDFMVQTAAIMGEGRIINVTCSVHNNDNGWSGRGVDILHMDNFQLQKETSFNGLQAYKNSKLSNVLATYYMDEHELKGTNVTINAVDPGLIPMTELNRSASSLTRLFGVCCLHNMLRCTHITKSSRAAAQEIVTLGTSDKFDGKSGKFWRELIEDRSSIESYDPDLQRDVYKISRKLVNLRSSSGGGDEDDFDDISLGTGPHDRLLTNPVA